jgi:hypothetical protein
VKEKTRSISTWHSYIQEQENRPGYARKNTPENYYKSYFSPKRWAFLSVSSLTFLLSKEKKDENTIEGERVESKGEERNAKSTNTKGTVSTLQPMKKHGHRQLQ